MKLFGGHARRRLSLIAVGLPAATAIAFIVAQALADAPLNSGSITATVGPPTSVNGTLVRTVTVQGTWAWPAHNSDCNGDRAGAGYAVSWDDPNQPGNHVGFVTGASV